VVGIGVDALQEIDWSYQVSRRFTFSRNILLLGIFILRSDIYSSIGDERPLQCITEGTEEEWNPRIGAQEYSPTNGVEIATENEFLLEAVAEQFGSAKWFGQAKTLTVVGLRDRLLYVLGGIERISDRPAFPLLGPGGSGLEGFNGEVTLLLIGIGLAITPFYSKIKGSLWNNTRGVL
jgi:hypothetical protein